MSVLGDLKEELEAIEGAKTLPNPAVIVMQIAKQIDGLELSRLPCELIFKAAIQACFGKQDL